MTRIISEPNALEDIDRLCNLLFDSWCERRSVIPLAYLMHAWPIAGATTLVGTRLQETLHALRQLHSDSLSPNDHQIIRQVCAIAALPGNADPEGFFE